MIFITLGCTGLFYGLRLYSQARYAANQISTPTRQSRQGAAKLRAKKPIAILLLGADTGAFGRTYQGNSDTMILALVNPKTQRTDLISIPRDTPAQIVGTKSFNMQKINAAYALGGPSMARATVEKLVNVPINYYLTIDMGGLKSVIDAVGGVDVTVPFSFDSSKTGGQHFTKGPAHLNGTQALAYVRMRKEDPRGDYGRQERQRQVIKAVVKATLSTTGLSQFSTVLKTLTKNLNTDLTFDDMVTIFRNYRGAAKTIRSTSITGYLAKVQTPLVAWELDFQIPATSELQRISDRARAALGLAKQPLQNAETRQNQLNPNFVFANVTYEQHYVIYDLSE